VTFAAPAVSTYTPPAPSPVPMAPMAPMAAEDAYARRYDPSRRVTPRPAPAPQAYRPLASASRVSAPLSLDEKQLTVRLMLVVVKLTPGK
jgi:hypothetical protein